MIYTVTLNPSVDYIVSVNDFKLGEINRTTKQFKNPGGKGINISRVLNNLVQESTALGFVGGFTGEFIQNSLEKENVFTDFIKVNGDSRINVKLKSNEETEINGESPEISAEDIERLKQKLYALKEDDYLVLAGSVPAGLSPDIYNELLEELSSKDVKVIIDTSGKALKESLHSAPFLIKPNHHELGELFEDNEITLEKAVTYGRKIVEAGVQNVIVSMAGEGALFINKDLALFGNVPEGQVKNSVGAGDSVVAGFIASYAANSNYEEAFRYSIAAGSATAFSDGFCDQESIHRLINEINITTL
ncbi:1-phosphofructokinase [Evansella clarkii]|uniref:1-phosphofructokinase n=1 Tax=Evansella clarkii TaxID=79879 RepID=UPI000B439F30|nr:1-phosphofructokinase [Evansella clarkii]